MAKVQFAAPYAQFRGRDEQRGTPNGNVAFASRNIPYTRRFTRGLQPNNQLQLISRYLFRVASLQWSALSNSDKDSWEALGLTFTRTNNVGFSYNPSGRSLFMEQFIFGARNAQSVLTTAPASLTWPTFPVPNDMELNTVPDEEIFFWSGTFAAGFFCIYTTHQISNNTRSTKGLHWVNPQFDASTINFTDEALVDMTGSPASQSISAANFAVNFSPVGTYGVRFQQMANEAWIRGETHDAILVNHGP